MKKNFGSGRNISRLGLVKESLPCFLLKGRFGGFQLFSQKEFFTHLVVEMGYNR